MFPTLATQENMSGNNASATMFKKERNLAKKILKQNLFWIYKWRRIK